MLYPTELRVLCYNYYAILIGKHLPALPVPLIRVASRLIIYEDTASQHGVLATTDNCQKIPIRAAGQAGDVVNTISTQVSA